MSEEQTEKLKQLEEELFGPIPQHSQTIDDTVFNKLDEQKNEKIQELKKRINSNWQLDEVLHEHDKENNFLSDLTLFRFLSGYEWSVDDAEPVLKGACEWRKKYEPWNVHIADVKKMAEQGAIFHFGFDKEGHPVIYVKLSRDQIENSSKESKDLKFKMFVWIYELVVRRMPEHIYQTTWICDISDASLSASLIRSMKDMFIELGTYYVERMARIYVLNTPMSYKFLWNVAKMFLTQTTINKYRIESSMKPDKLRNYFSELFDLKDLISAYGGDKDYKFDYQKLVEYDNLRLNRNE